MTKTNDNERQYRDSLQFPASEAENLCSFNTRLAEVTYYLIIINIAISLNPNYSQKMAQSYVFFSVFYQN